MIQEKIPDSVMLEWLKKLRVHFGRPISSTDARLYRKKHQDTAPSVSTIIDRFGSWNAALKAAGLETCSPGAPYKISKIEERKKAAIGLLKLFYKEKGRTPTVSDFLYSKMHGLSYRTIADLFGGWNNALAAAGLEIGIKTKDPLSQIKPILNITVDMTNWNVKKIKNFLEIFYQSRIEFKWNGETDRRSKC